MANLGCQTCNFPGSVVTLYGAICAFPASIKYLLKGEKKRGKLYENKKSSYSFMFLFGGTNAPILNIKALVSA